MAPTDGMIRLAMATIRDSLRSGKSLSEKNEAIAAVQAPLYTRVWEASARSLYMPVSATFNVIGQGEFFAFIPSNMQHGVTFKLTWVFLALSRFRFLI